MTVPRFHWMVKLHLYSCQSHLWKYIAPLIRDIPNASLAWKLNASKCIWVSMLFNINNQTSHYWMSFVYVHFVCVFWILRDSPTWTPVLLFGPWFVLLFWYVVSLQYLYFPDCIVFFSHTHSVNLIKPFCGQRWGNPTSRVATVHRSPTELWRSGWKITFHGRPMATNPMNCRWSWASKPPENLGNRSHTNHSKPRPTHRREVFFWGGVESTVVFFHVVGGRRFVIFNGIFPQSDFMNFFSKIQLFFSQRCV